MLIMQVYRRWPDEKVPNPGSQAALAARRHPAAADFLSKYLDERKKNLLSLFKTEASSVLSLGGGRPNPKENHK